MDKFYVIVLSTGAVFLILILTILGIMMSYHNGNSVFPSSQRNCPDYWVFDGSYCKIPENEGGINTGLLQYNNTTWSNADNSHIPGITKGSSINFNDESWVSYSTQSGQSSICGLKSWANSNTIEWDGITNYNQC